MFLLLFTVLVSFVSTNIVEDASASMRVEANQPEKVEAAFHDTKLRCSVCRWLVDKVTEESWILLEFSKGQDPHLLRFTNGLGKKNPKQKKYC